MAQDLYSLVRFPYVGKQDENKIAGYATSVIDNMSNDELLRVISDALEKLYQRQPFRMR